MYLNPGLHELELIGRNRAFEDVALWQGQDRLVCLVLHMYVWDLVPPVVSKVLGNDDAVEHGDDWHCVVPFVTLPTSYRWMTSNQLLSRT